ncbi:MAG: sporulation protein YtfJ [Clostridiales bacterium]|nr:sporulation protein YtfJ [Clostridiales bacterium]
MEHPIGHLMQTTLENIKQMVDVDTVIGQPIQALDGSTVIPLSKVSFGFVCGGGEYQTNRAVPPDQPPFAGGSGAGVSLQPVGFLVVGPEGVRVLPAQQPTAWERALNNAPQLMDDIRSLLSPKQEKTPKEGPQA